MKANLSILGIAVITIQCVFLVDGFSSVPSAAPHFGLRSNNLVTCRNVVNRNSMLGKLSMKKTETISRDRKAKIMEAARKEAASAQAQEQEQAPPSTAFEVAQEIAQIRTPPLAIGKYSSKGANTHHSNQDDAMFSLNLPKLDGAAIMGVFDGHGEQGGNVAQRLAKKLPAYFVERCSAAPKTSTDDGYGEKAKRCFETAFSDAEQDLEEYVKGVDHSGSTATVAVIQGRTLALGWVGDSRAVIGGHTQGGIGMSQDLSSGIKGGVHVEALTHDHDVKNKEENKRIQKAGGEFRHSHLDMGIEGDYAYYRGEQWPGLGVTRSMGDKNGKREGEPLILAEPEVVVRKLRSTDEVVVMATDGVWKYVSDAEAIRAVLPFLPSRDAKEAAKALTALARERWMQHGSYADDTTTVVIIL